MSAIPSTFGRIPTLLASTIRTNNLVQTNASLLQLQEQLATGLRINRPSDDAIAAAMISELDHRLDRDGQFSRNIDHARTVLSSVDESLSELGTLLLEAKSIASSQVGVGSDATSRSGQAIVVDSLINQAFGILNRDMAGIHYFGGGATGAPPFESFNGGFRYLGHGDGLRTELGDSIEFPITISGDTAAGAHSSRVEGSVDLNPILTATTRIEDLRGPALGRAPLGVVNVTIDDSVTPVTIQVDLTGAQTVGDALLTLESAILDQDPGALTGVYPSNLSLAGERLVIGNVAPAYTITFSDGPTGSTATALGIDSFTYDSANAISTNAGADLDPRVTEHTTLGALSPATPLAYGDIVFNNGGATGTVTITPTMTVGELREAISRLDLGLKLEIDDSGDSINVINTVSGFRMSIEEGGSTSASTLGIRSFDLATLGADLNDGRGIEIADGAIDPVTGLPDPARNLDFQITLTDGSSFSVDLTPADIATVQDVINKINADAAAAGFGGVFTAGLGATTNGIVLQDTAGGAGAITVTSLNAYAAEDLGLLDGTFTGGVPATFAGTDPATVRVESVFSVLIDLREALEANDERGITFAGGLLEREIDRVSQAQSLIGGRSARLDGAQRSLEDRMILDESIRSNVRDLDYVEATSRFSLLQTQMQAGYQTTAALAQLSLLNFLG